MCMLIEDYKLVCPSLHIRLLFTKQAKLSTGSIYPHICLILILFQAVIPAERA